jgi:hypothetical protein
MPNDLSSSGHAGHDKPPAERSGVTAGCTAADCRRPRREAGVRGLSRRSGWSSRTPTSRPWVMHALDDVSVHLELGHDGGREVNPAGAKLGKSERLGAGLAQALQQPLLP